MNAKGPDYGVDAPYVIRNLAIAGFILLGASVAQFAGFLPLELVLHPASGVNVRIPIGGWGVLPGIACALTACWLYFGSRSGKIAERDRLLNRIKWRGDERVLDIGCGRGLILVGAARRLTTGLAIGIDVWQKEDLSGNQPEVALKNAEIEGVDGRVSVETADMRRLPFENGSFDVVTSRAAIHNLYSAPDRETAIREIARVLKPGGCALIVDIRHLQQYVRVFEDSGCSDVRLLDSRVVSALWALVTMGGMRPNTLLARKAV